VRKVKLRRLAGFSACCRFATEDASAAITVGETTFLGDHYWQRRASRLALQKPSLMIKPPERSKFLLAPQLRLLHG
jgi:hypothetical protein